MEVRQIGENGTDNAYVLNYRVVWSGPREGLRYSLFSAPVVVSDSEQPERDTLGKQEPLRRLPPIGERQLPQGDGLPPRSEEHTSDLQSLMRISYADFCLNKQNSNYYNTERSALNQTSKPYHTY